MSVYSLVCQRDFYDKLREAIRKMGFIEHPSTPLRHDPTSREMLHICTWCGCLVSLLDTHVQECKSFPGQKRRAIQTHTNDAALIILGLLRLRWSELSEQERQHLYACAQGPCADRLELVAKCEEAHIAIYPYLLAEKQLIASGQIFTFRASVYPHQDLKIALTQPAVASA